MTSKTEFEVARVDATSEAFDDTLHTPTGMSEPVIHCFGYDPSGGWHHSRIRGFEPYCYVRYEVAATAREMDGTKRVELYNGDGEEFESVRGQRLAKVVCYTTSGVDDLADSSDVGQTWESDVLLPDRFIADMDLASGLRVPVSDGPAELADVEVCECIGEWRIHYVDIEVNDRNGFPEGGTEPILCITAYDTFKEEYIVWMQGHGEDADYPTESTMHDAAVDIRWFESEIAMLKSYFAFISGSRPAVITGWNSNDFDLPYLFDRGEQLNISWQSMSPIHKAHDHHYFGVEISGMVALDMLKAFKGTQFTELDSYQLEAVAQDFIGTSKETFIGKIGDLWENDPAKLVEYNLRDVELCVELDREQDIIPFWKEVKRIGRCRLSDAVIESSVVNKYLVNQLHGDRVLPQKGSQPNVSSSYSGGAVFDAYNGLAQNVGVFDLASLYPMSMLTINASPETKLEAPEGVDADSWEPDVPYFEAPNGIKFRKDQTGITREIIEDLYARRTAKKEERDEHDPGTRRYDILDRQQTALKVIMNSLYGVMAWNRFRLYDQDVASAVTATGRDVLQFTAEVSDEMGYTVLYGDTDSVLLDFDDDTSEDTIIEELGPDIEATINERYADFAADELRATEEHRFEIEFEKLYRRYFQSGQKKRYAGDIVWKEGKRVSELDITGYEYKRSDSAPLSNEVQKEVLHKIVTDSDPSEIGRYVSEQLQRFDTRDLTLDDIGIPEGIGKRMDKYDRPTHTVQAAKYSNLLLGTSFNNGSKPRRYYLDDVDPALFRRLEQEGVVDPKRDPLYNIWKDEHRFIAVTNPEELPPEVAIDWEKMQSKVLGHSLKTITNALGLEWDELKAGDTQTTLEAY